MLRGLVVLLAVAAEVQAAPATRVIVAANDPELVSALETTLAPWHFEVVVIDSAITIDSTAAAEREATARQARFVVWRRDPELIVFDAERGSAEHRDGPTGPLDAASAIAAALTVKTLMRLPPPDDTRLPGQSTFGARISVDVGGRAAFGSTTLVGGRLALAVAIRPWAPQLRVGLLGEVGTAATVDAASFHGDWSDYCALAFASWTRARDRLELSPMFGLGVVRSTLDGREGGMGGQDPRTESATQFALRAAVAVHYRLGSIRVGPELGIDARLGSPTYVRRQGAETLFRVPSLAVSLGLAGAVDFGR